MHTLKLIILGMLIIGLLGLSKAWERRHYDYEPDPGHIEDALPAPLPEPQEADFSHTHSFGRCAVAGPDGSITVVYC